MLGHVPRMPLADTLYLVTKGGTAVVENSTSQIRSKREDFTQNMFEKKKKS